MPFKTIGSEETARQYVERWADQLAFERLDRFCALLIEENRRQNLISKSSELLIWQRHIADSAQLLEHVPRETCEDASAGPWLDLGTGAGPPGIVISILRPEKHVCLVESRGRRAEFLEQCVDELDLVSCEVLGARLERIDPFSCSVISARAFAPLDKLLKLSAPFSTKATTHVLPKGRSAAQELKQQNAAIQKMFHVEQSLTDGDAGIIVSSNTAA